jgi:signal transduction histidine kinase/ligand-binding sensor domain-containing protein
MPPSRFSKLLPRLAIITSSFAAVVLGLLAQGPQQSPTPSPQPSASASPAPLPTRIPTPTPLPATQNFHQWGSVTVFNGLPSDAVRAIAQTADGVMWFGTDNGLARFDGRRIQKFAFGGGDESRVTALESSPNGGLWIGTRSGAFVYNGDGFRPIEGTHDVGILAILIGNETYLGTDTGQVLRVSRDGNGNAEDLLAVPLQLADKTPAAITSLVESNGKLFAGTISLGTFIIDGNSPTEIRFAPKTDVVNALARDDKGQMWLASDAPKGISGIYVLDAALAAKRVTALTAKVLAIEANDSGIWAGTERYGLFHIADSKLKKNYTFENTSGGLRSNTIFTIFTDREGVIWIGTNRGVSRFDRSGAFQQTVSDIPNSNFIRTLYQNESSPLYAGSNRGLFFQKSDDTWGEIPSLKNRPVYAIRKRFGSSILIGTPDGLYEITGGKLMDGDVRSLAGFNGRDFAAISGMGVFDVSGRPQLVHGDENVTSIFAGPDRLWIGTAGKGLLSYDGQKVKNEVGPDVLKSGTIWNMYQAASGPLYIAGQHGVFVIRDNNVEQIVSVQDVRDVIEVNGEVWAATTTRGLLHARCDERFGWLITSIGFEQGLPSEKAFSIIPAGDKLAIATNRGIVTYKPGSVAPKLIATRILSQRVHDLTEIRSNIPLDYPQNSLVVEVAGQSSRTFPEEFQYAFTLTNRKGEVVDSHVSNDAQYAPTNLPAGDYTIEAIAFNRDLLASDPLNIKFSVAKAPFPWTATALAALLALAVIGLVWAAFEHRRIRHRNRELAIARFDLANEAERERIRIARDLHDQTLADLRNLMMKSDQGSLSGAEIRNEIESVSTEIRRICEDLSPSVLENVGLVPALEFLLSQTAARHTFSAEENIDERFQFPMNVQLQIYRIAQEVLANIRRHSNADQIEMQVESEGGKFLLTIGDNGPAFQPDKSVGKGRGIANIRSRANLIGGAINWNGRKNGGNLFSLRITGK